MVIFYCPNFSPPQPRKRKQFNYMDTIVFKITMGAVQADEHYLATGHKIEHLMTKVSSGMDFIDYKSKYQCKDCAFTSYGGTRIKQL